MRRIYLCIVALLMAGMAMAQETYVEFYERISRETRISPSDKKQLVKDMTQRGGGDLYIDGEKYLISSEPLRVSSMHFQDMISHSEGLSFAYVWGDYSDSNSTINYDFGLIDGKLCMTHISHSTPYLPNLDVKDAERNARIYGWVVYSADTIYARIERHTGCKFTKTTVFTDDLNRRPIDLDVELPLTAFTGVLYAKRANTAPRPKRVAGKEVTDFPEYVRWYKEPIFRLTFENGELVSKEKMIEPIPLDVVKKMVTRGVAIAVLILLLIALLFVARDNRRKKYYLHLQEELQKNQLQLINAQEQCEEAVEKVELNREEVLALYKESFTLCYRRFEVGRWASMLEALSASLQPMPMTLSERQALSQALDECFIQVNVNLRSEGRLTKDDVRCCLLALIGCPLPIVAVCLGCSYEAVHARKSRLKDKLPKDIFEWVFAK